MTLDEAWADLVAALPPDWHIDRLHSGFANRDQWTVFATANRDADHQRHRSIFGQSTAGLAPALVDLASRLRALPEAAR